MAMKTATYACIVVLAGALVAGCAGRSAEFSTAVAQTPSPTSVGATEWLESVSSLQTTAVITTYDEAGAALVRNRATGY